MTAADLEDSELRDQRVLLAELDAEFLDGALLDEEVLLEVGDLASEGIDFSAFTDESFEFSGGEHDSDGEVLVLDEEDAVLSITAGEVGGELGDFNGHLADLLEESVALLGEETVSVVGVPLGSLHEFGVVLEAEIESL